MRRGAGYLADAMKAAAGAVVGGAVALGNGLVGLASGVTERTGNLLVGHGFRTDSEYHDYLVKTAIVGDGVFLGAGAIGSNQNFNASDEFDLNSQAHPFLPYQRDIAIEGESQRNNMALGAGTDQWNMCFLTSTANALTDKFGIQAEDGQKIIKDLVFDESEDSAQRKSNLEAIMLRGKNMTTDKFDQETIDKLKNYATLSNSEKDDLIRDWVGQIGQLEDTMDVIREINGYNYEGAYRNSNTIINVLRHFDCIADITNSNKYSDDTKLISYVHLMGDTGSESKTDAEQKYSNFSKFLDQNYSNAAVILSTKLSDSGHMVYLKGIESGGIIVNDPYGYGLERKPKANGGTTYRYFDQDNAYTYRVNWKNVNIYKVGYGAESWRYNMLIRKKNPVIQNFMNGVTNGF